MTQETVRVLAGELRPKLQVALSNTRTSYEAWSDMPDRPEGEPMSDNAWVAHCEGKVRTQRQRGDVFEELVESLGRLGEKPGEMVDVPRATWGQLRDAMKIDLPPASAPRAARRPPLAATEGQG